MRLRAILFLAALLPVFSWPVRAPVAWAHGREVAITLRCDATEPSAPLDLVCRARVVYASDGDPVTDAQILLAGTRPGRSGSELRSLRLERTAEPGVYAAPVALPAYGTWRFTVEAQKPAEGSVVLVREVLPPSGAVSPAAEVRARLIIDFGARDVANLAVLAAHLGATVSIVALNAAVVGAALLGSGPEGLRYRRIMVGVFPRGAAVAISVIAASGAYSVMYNAPTRAPGLLRPESVASLPFGEAYLAAFALKMLLATLLLGGSAALALRLRRSPSWRTASIAGGAVSLPLAAAGRRAESPVRRLTTDACGALAALNLVVAATVLLVVVAVGYLHLLTHAGAFTGGF